jgi:hypothetical protein
MYFTSFHNLWLQKSGHIPFLFFGTFHKLRVTADHVPRALHMRDYTYWLYRSVFSYFLCWADALSEELYAMLKKDNIFQFSLVLDRLDEIVCES